MWFTSKSKNNPEGQLLQLVKDSEKIYERIVSEKEESISKDKERIENFESDPKQQYLAEMAKKDIERTNKLLTPIQEMRDKYVKLMSRNTHSPTQQKMEIAQDWAQWLVLWRGIEHERTNYIANNIFDIFGQIGVGKYNESDVDRSHRPVRDMLNMQKEIEKRFDEKLRKY